MLHKTPYLLLAWLVLAGTPAGTAHELETSGKVGALMHIQPDDSPKAGVATTAWFGLVKRGGDPVRLTECACELKIYSGKTAGRKALLTPELQEGRAEEEPGNKDRLLAGITFPRVGAYTMVLTGKPKSGARFDAFRLQWVVQATP